MKHFRVTHQDIARQTGLHKSTVSLVFKKDPSIPEQTRERVLSVAKNLGYQPDPALAALAAYSQARRRIRYHDTLAFVSCWPKRQAWRTVETFASFFQGATERAMQLGYKVEECWMAEPGMSAKRFSDVLYHRNIRGLILAPLPTPRGHLKLEWQRYSVVSVGYSLIEPQFHRVSNHQYRSMVEALRQIYNYGYARVGMVTHREIDQRVDYNWTAGFYGGKQQVGISSRIPPLVMHTYEFGEFEKWFLKYRPEVIVTSLHVVAKWLARLKLKVPEQVGYVQLDCSNPSGESTGIYQNWNIMGMTAVDLLIGQLHRNECGIPVYPTTTLIEGTWISGSTLISKNDLMSGQKVKRR